VAAGNWYTSFVISPAYPDEIEKMESLQPNHMQVRVIMNRRTAVVLGVALLVLTARAAWAHDGHIHTIMGTVMERDAQAVQVKTPGGETLSIAITDKTRVVRGKQKAAVADVQKGSRVVVDIGNGEDPLIANEIRLGPLPVAPKK